ncbi:MAG: FHIPEP family type III secretion protein, partial [Rhodospirillales bacterium]
MAEATTELETAPTAGVPAPVGGVPAEVMGDEPGQGAALDTVFQGAPPTAAEAAIGEIGRDLLDRIAGFKGRADIALALGIIAILVVLILPVPTWLLDVSLAFSIMFSVLILMTVIFLEKPLEFSAFPTILLIATL